MVSPASKPSHSTEMVSLIGKALITIFWPNKIRLKNSKMHRNHYSFLISYKYHNFQWLCTYHTFVLVRKCLCLLFRIDISVVQLEYNNQVPRAPQSRWSAPHQKLPTQDGQSHQQGTCYNILGRRNET